MNSYGRSLPIHEFTSPPFPKAPRASAVVHRVTSVAGHVFNVDFPPEYQSWDSVDPAELFYAPVVKKPCKGSVVKHLQDATKGVDFIVLWMDCDREGENINFEVLDCCLSLMRGSAPYDRVYRAHFSAINPSVSVFMFQCRLLFFALCSVSRPSPDSSYSQDIQRAYKSLGKVGHDVETPFHCACLSAQTGRSSFLRHCHSRIGVNRFQSMQGRSST